MKRLIILAVLYSTVLFSNHRNQKQQGFVSVFGDQITGERTDQLSFLFQYDIPIADNDRLSFNITGDTSSTATIRQTDGMLRVASGIDTTVTVNVVTRDALHYSPGHEGDAYFTSIFTGTAANSTQWIGLFDDENGFAVGYQNTTFGVLFRRTSTDVFIPQSSFNLDRLDGTGSSGFKIDTTKLNVFCIRYGWLGAAPITYNVLREDGLWIPFHRINQPNSETGPSVENPTLPLKIDIRKTGSTATSLEIKTASWNANIVGQLAGQRNFVTALANNVTIPNGTFTPLIALKNKDTFRGSTNHTTMQVLYTNMASAVNNDHISTFYYIKYSSETAFRAAVSGGTFSDINSSLSVAEQILNTDTTTPMSFDSQPAAYNSVFIVNLGTGEHGDYFLKGNEYPIKVFPGEVLVVAGRANANNVPVALTISWEEQD